LSGPTVDISDPDEPFVESADFRLIDRLDGAQEALSLSPLGLRLAANVGLVVWPYNPFTGTLELRGTATHAHYEALVEEALYGNSSALATAGARHIEVVVSNGGFVSNVAVSTIHVVPEPSTAVLVGLGIVGIAVQRRRVRAA